LQDCLVTATDAEPRTSLWGRDRRAATVGIVVIITALAFENLGVSTAMPRMLAELDGNALYSWPFTAFQAASVTATVLCGRVSDRFGPAPALLAGPSLFLAGLLVAGTASGMPALLAGRVLQGLGSGTGIVAVYVLVALVYPEDVRPRVFGLVATSWLVPALVGPTAAGLITEQVGWRWVFLGLVPFAVLALLLLLRTTRRLPDAERAAPPRRGLALAAVATGFGVSALTWAAQHPSVANAVLGVGGLAALIPALRVMLPRGTLTARPGLPMVILSRGLLAGAMFGVEAFVPLTLVAVHHQPVALAGLPLTIASIGWVAGSQWQGRHPGVARTTLIRTSFLILAAALAAMTLVAPSWGPAWLAGPLWLVAGLGMGIGFPSISVLTLKYAPEGDKGFASAAVQVSDMTGSALTVGFGGVLLTTLASATHPTAAVIVLDLLMAGLALAGAVLFRPGRVARAPDAGD
jgi:MFS family permease